MSLRIRIVWPVCENMHCMVRLDLVESDLLIANFSRRMVDSCVRQAFSCDLLLQSDRYDLEIRSQICMSLEYLATLTQAVLFRNHVIMVAAVGFCGASCGASMLCTAAFRRN